MILSQRIKFHNNQYRMKMIKRRIARLPLEFPTQEWEQVLESAKKDQDIQDYLERYPELLSGLFDLQNGLLHDIVISKLPFGADLKYELIFKHID